MQVETVETKGFEARQAGQGDACVLSEVKSLHASLHVLFACSQIAICLELHLKSPIVLIWKGHQALIVEISTKLQLFKAVCHYLNGSA